MKKKDKFLVVPVLFIFINASAQFFEGHIKYSNSYKSKMNSVSSAQFEKMMGTQQVYIIKDNYYKSVFNGSYLEIQLYRGDENRCYTLTSQSDTLFWEDCMKNNDAAISYEIKLNQDSVLGIICNEIIVTSLKSKMHIFYNEKFKINPEQYKNHNYGNWYYFISKTKSVPLKTVLETDQFIFTSIASEIKSYKINDNAFLIVDKLKISKARW